MKNQSSKQSKGLTKYYDPSTKIKIYFANNLKINSMTYYFYKQNLIQKLDINLIIPFYKNLSILNFHKMLGTVQYLCPIIKLENYNFVKSKIE